VIVIRFAGSFAGSHVTFRSAIPPHHWRVEERKSIKRTLAIILAALAASAVFGGLVYAVLVAVHVSEPAATTVYGLTLRRLWATTAAFLALAGVVVGGAAALVLAENDLILKTARQRCLIRIARKPDSGFALISQAERRRFHQVSPSIFFHKLGRLNYLGFQALAAP
jgi:hypothetical protein